MAKIESPLLLTVREASLLLRIHRPKIYDLIKEGVLTGFKIGSDWRIRRESLEKLIGPIPPEFFLKLKGDGEDSDDAEQAPPRKVA